MRPYFEPKRGRTTWLNLMEVYYALLRDGTSRQSAREVVASFESLLVDFSFQDALDAIDLRAHWPRRRPRISDVDALSYHLAVRRKMRFLTADRAFKGLPNVTFFRLP